MLLENFSCNWHSWVHRVADHIHQCLHHHPSSSRARIKFPWSWSPMHKMIKQVVIWAWTIWTDSSVPQIDGTLRSNMDHNRTYIHVSSLKSRTITVAAAKLCYDKSQGYDIPRDNAQQWQCKGPSQFLHWSWTDHHESCLVCVVLQPGWWPRHILSKLLQGLVPQQIPPPEGNQNTIF